LVNTKSLMMVLSFRAQTSKASPVFHASIASNLARLERVELVPLRWFC
jgi:hypothetical protein